MIRTKEETTPVRTLTLLVVLGFPFSLVHGGQAGSSPIEIQAEILEGIPSDRQKGRDSPGLRFCEIPLEYRVGLIPLFEGCRENGCSNSTLP